jgi:hypothetical protein
LASAEERGRYIEGTYAYLLQDVLVLRLTEETLRLVLVLKVVNAVKLAQSAIILLLPFWFGSASSKSLMKPLRPFIVSNTAYCLTIEAAAQIAIYSDDFCVNPIVRMLQWVRLI